MSDITVLGAGSWGTALALLLSRNGLEVCLWSHEPAHVDTLQHDREHKAVLPGASFPDNLSLSSDLSESLRAAKNVLVVVPSHVFRHVITLCQPHLLPTARMAWGTKGVDPDTHQLLHTIVLDVLGEDRPMAVVSGPNFAKEVAAGLPGATSVASYDEALLEDWARFLRSDTFRVYKSDDIIGTQLCGTVKNVMAIAAGVSDGLALGDNARCALITRGLSEMGRLCEALGGQHNTVMGLAGVGDLVLTCTGDKSRNRQFGLALGRGLSVKSAEHAVGQTVEGLYNTRQINALATAHGVDMPIVRAVYRIIEEGISAQAAAKELLGRGLNS